MWNFKKVLLGERHNLNVNQNSEWPELTSSNHDNKKSPNQNRSLEPVGSTQIEASPSANVLSSEFPNLSESIGKQLDRRNRIPPAIEKSAKVSLIKNINNESNRTYKLKPMKSQMNISVDINTMLKVSLSMAERKRQLKRTHRLRKRSTCVSGVPCGNKLDSDCPVRHKGKKRLHRRRKITTTKRNFKWAAVKTPLRNVTSAHLTRKLNSLRQMILAGFGKGCTVDELVHNIGSLCIEDSKKEDYEEKMQLKGLETSRSIIHTKNFRPYCDHLLKSSIKNKSCDFIKTLRSFQDKMYKRDPTNSKNKRRYVCGCHEARKFLRIADVKLLFIARNLAVDNGIPPILDELIQMAKDLDVPIIYSATALDLGFWTLKKRKTSVLAVLNYEGAEKLFSELLQEVMDARKDYEKLIEKINFYLEKRSTDQESNLTKDTLFEDVEEELRQSIISKLVK